MILKELQFFLCLLIPLLCIFVYYLKVNDIYKKSFFIILGVQGFAVFLTVNYLEWYLGLTLIFSSSYFVLKDSEYNFHLDPDFKFSPLLNIFLLNGRLSPYLFFISSGLFFFTLILEKLLFDGRISDTTLVVLFLSICMFIESININKYLKEIQYCTTFFLLLFVFFVIPDVSHQYLFGELGKDDPGWFEDSIWVYWFLALPLSNLLQIFGYYSFAESSVVYYVDNDSNTLSSVLISGACTGIFTTIIFFSAFLSYIIMERKLLNINLALYALLGLVMAYIANLIRMTIVVLSGHYYGPEALQYVHANVGWIIFTFWISVFWYFLPELPSKND